MTSVHLPCDLRQLCSDADFSGTTILDTTVQTLPERVFGFVRHAITLKHVLSQWTIR